MNTSQQGITAVAAILAVYTAKGFTVSVPFGDKAKYDLVVERNGELVRVQCKLGRKRANGAITFRTYSESKTSGKRSCVGYTGTADVFAVFCDGTVYEIPVADVPSTECSLRVLKTRNGQNEKIRHAESYKI